MPGSLEVTTDADAARALTTYRNYLAALGSFMRAEYGNPSDRLQRVAETQNQLPGFQSIAKTAAYSTVAVRKLLFNAWHTEVVLNLPEFFSDPGLIRFTNQWAPVQAYYAIYSLWRAWFLLQQSAASTHVQCLRSASALVRERHALPVPWDHACRGGFLLRDAEHLAFRETSMGDVNALSTPTPRDASGNWISKILRTTRHFFLEQQEAKWKKDNRTTAGNPYRRIPPAQRHRIRDSLYPTTLFDFLYRLRIRSNYRDVDDFVSGVLTASDAEVYFQALVGFTRTTLLLLEGLVRTAMREGEFDQLANQFLQESQRAQLSLLSDRISVLQNVHV